MVLSKIITGWDTELRNNYTILQRGLLFVFCFSFYHVSRNCEWYAQFYNHQTQTLADIMAYGCSNIVSLRRQGHKQREKGIKHKFSEVC